MKHEPVPATVRRTFGSVRGAGAVRFSENMEDVFHMRPSGISEHPRISYDVSSRRGA